MDDTRTRQDVWSIARLLEWTRNYFEQREIEAPRLCAELLLANALGCERIQLYTRYEETPDEATRDRFRLAVREAADGKPIAYIVGHREFFSLRFAVTPDVLVPRPETEVLVERTLAVLRRGDWGAEGPRVLDIGTGSGCVIAALACNFPTLRGFASDVSGTALAVARQNADTLNLADRIEFREADLFTGWTDAAPFDVIVSNPPYIGERERNELPANVRDHEPAVALFAGADGLDLYRRFVNEAAAALSPGGHLLLEVGFRQANAVADLLKQAGWRDITRCKDHLQHERVVHARAPHTAAPGS